MKILERLRKGTSPNPQLKKDLALKEKTITKLEKEWDELAKLRKTTDDIFLKMANVLGVKEKTYDNIYSAFEKKLGKPKKG